MDNCSRKESTSVDAGILLVFLHLFVASMEQTVCKSSQILRLIGEPCQNRGDVGSVGTHGGEKAA